MNQTESVDVERWWRVLCEVKPRLYLCGDLPSGEEFDAVLSGWVDAGVTDIVDVRDEWSDEDRVAVQAPSINYHWLGTHDDGGPQDLSWFASGVAAIADVLGEPDSRAVVHCHMGINRAPSLVFAALLDMGHEIEESLQMIRSARPIAAILYAGDAVRWFAQDRGWTDEQLEDALGRTASWLDDNDFDVIEVISRIRLAERG